MRPLRIGSLQIERLVVEVDNLPDALSGCKILQLSDFHYDGERLSERLLAEAIARCNAETPDLIVLTGDFVTHDPSWIDPLVAQLRRLRARAGVVASLGNHDLHYQQSRPRIVAALERADITVLWNAITYPFGPGLAVVGLADYWSPEYRPAPVFARVPTSVPRIVLSHNPDSAVGLQHFRVDLQLSGHTHGGQIQIPGYGPLPKLLQRLSGPIPKPLLPRAFRKCDRVVNVWRYARGPYRAGKNFLYVNRGLGTYFPGRWGCPPEIAVFALECSG